MRAAPDWLPQIPFCIRRKKGTCWIFSLTTGSRVSLHQVVRTGLYKWKRNLPLVMAFFSQSNPWANGMETANVAQDWKCLLLKQRVPQSPSRQSPHWWQHWVVSLKWLTGKGKVGVLNVLVTNWNSSGRDSGWEIKFNTLNFTWGRQDLSWHSGFSLKKLAFEILRLKFKVQKCPMVAIPVFFEVLFFLIQHIQYL